MDGVGDFRREEGQRQGEVRVVRGEDGKCRSRWREWRETDGLESDKFDDRGGI